MATASKTASPKMEVEAEKPKSKWRLIALIVAAVLISGGAVAWYFMIFEDNTPTAEAKPAPQPPVFLPMDPLTVNLQTEDGDRFLQVGLTLQVANQEQIDLIKLYMPHVRSRLLLLLSAQKAADILSANGKKRLAEDIIQTLGQPFTPDAGGAKVTSVLFVSFVVQ